MVSTQILTCPDCGEPLDPNVTVERERVADVFQVGYCRKCRKHFQRRIVDGEPPHPWEGITHYHY